jgi:hypothetical protein
MRLLSPILIVSLVLSTPALAAHAQSYDQPENLQSQAEQLMELANQSRAQAGTAPLNWDPALAQAALAHCARMVAEGPIAHRYNGELDVAGRAAQAGAHFSLIEENVAVGPNAPAIHDEWMHSPGHRTNLLNSQVNRVGIAILASRGTLYAVADYSSAVRALSPFQVEASIGNLIRPSGLTVLADPSVARSYCASDRGPAGAPRPGFIMLWQGSDLTHLPQQLVDRLSSGQYHRAAIGNCPAQSDQSAFTSYRIAVLLY